MGKVKAWQCYVPQSGSIVPLTYKWVAPFPVQKELNWSKVHTPFCSFNTFTTSISVPKKASSLEKAPSRAGFETRLSYYFQVTNSKLLQKSIYVNSQPKKKKKKNTGVAWNSVKSFTWGNQVARNYIPENYVVWQEKSTA